MPRSDSRWPGCHLQGFLPPLARSPGPLTLECHPNPCSIQALGPCQALRAWLPTCPATGELHPLSPSYLQPPGGGQRGPEEVWTAAVLRTPLRADQ